MANFIRYALATFFFATSVSCVALWGWSVRHHRWESTISYYMFPKSLHITVADGVAIAEYGTPDSLVRFQLEYEETLTRRLRIARLGEQGWFGKTDQECFFPLWYAALLFALAGVAALRFRRQFSIRSTLIATTIVATSIAMAVIL